MVERTNRAYWQSALTEGERCVDLKWWADLLEEWPVDSVDKALTQWVLDNPNKRPNPGHIVQILKAAWAKHNAPVLRQWKEEQARARPQPMSRERHAELVAELGDKLGQFIRRIEPPRET